MTVLAIQRDQSQLIFHLPTRRERIITVANYCFESLKSIVTFPLRFLGSKTWSIPGALIRTPWLLFKRIFQTQKISLKEELFGNRYQYFFEKDLAPAELESYLHYAYATQFVATMRPTDIPLGWNHVPSLEIARGIKGARTDGSFVDPTTGFKAIVLEKEEELMICFGALGLIPGITQNTTLWKRPGLLTKALIKNEPPAVRQIARSLVGGVPPVYEKAARFVETLRSLPRFQTKTVTLTGLCYGGSIAAYVGIKRGMKALSLNSFPLTPGVQEALGADRLNQAGRHITHISVKGDYLSDRSKQPYLDIAVSRIGIRTSGFFGRRFRIPSTFTSSHKTHSYFLASALKHVAQK